MARKRTSSKAAAPAKAAKSPHPHGKSAKKGVPLVANLSRKDLKYHLYEHSVQCPDWHVQHFPRFALWLTGKRAKLLREDFCGTGRISVEWVKSAKDRRAIGLDLDPEPLDYFERMHRAELTAEESKRLSLKRGDVLVPTKEKFDLIAACNFSFFIFHSRAMLLKYFKSARASLKPGGTLFLEMAGGEGMFEGIEEERNFTVKGIGKVRYVWDQMEYDPIQAVNDYAIHFRLPGKSGKKNGKWIRNAFEYHWRLWGIREVRDILADAGFSKTQVFWESCDSRGNGTGEYVPMNEGDHAHAWIAYVAAVR